VGKARMILLVALLVGLAAATLINEIGISRYPPAGVFPDGAMRGFYPSDVRSCMGARALASVGDRTSEQHWHHCARTLVQTQALSSFDRGLYDQVITGQQLHRKVRGFSPLRMRSKYLPPAGTG
jgi:hypothetical protein